MLYLKFIFFPTRFNASNPNEEPVIKSVDPTEQFLFYFLLQKPNAAGKRPFYIKHLLSIRTIHDHWKYVLPHIISSTVA